MKRGFSGPLDPHLAPRKPLRPDGLDKNVICGMGGFGFGTEEEIERRLLEVLESDAYRRAIEHWESKQAIDNLQNEVTDDKYWSPLSNAPLGCESSEIDSITLTPKKPNCFSGFSLRGQKYLSLAFSPSLTSMLHSPPKSQLPPYSRDAGETGDQMCGFHPLVSIYSLAQEKAERVRSRPG